MRPHPGSPLFPYTTLFRSPRPRFCPRRRGRGSCSAGSTSPGSRKSRRSCRRSRRSSAARPSARVSPRSTPWSTCSPRWRRRSEEHTSELQSHSDLVCRLLLDAPAPRLSPLSLHDALPISEAAFLPAPAGQGIVFRRVDLAGKPQIPALLSEVEAVERRTAIGKGESTIHTVEHLLAAVAAHEIDDLTVELSGPEPPILDGSVQPYFDALEHAGPTETGGDDLVLTGGRVRAHIVATRPSHGGNIALARALTRAAQRGGAPKMDIGRIMDVLPHRYPFLLVDRIIEVEGQQRIVGIKNVTINEPFFQGHFPGHPIMPGVLIIEAMAQVGGMLLM